MNVLMPGVDKNKLALLQSRLGVVPSEESEQVPPQPSGENQHMSPSETEVSDRVPPLIIDICESSSPNVCIDEGNSKGKSKDNAVADWPKSLLRYEEHTNSNHSKHGRDSISFDDGKKENTPKRQKQEGVDPSPDGNNSRGAVTGMRKLETYFQSNGPSSFASSGKALAQSSTPSSSSTNTLSNASTSLQQPNNPTSNAMPSAQGSIPSSSITTTTTNSVRTSSTQQTEKGGAIAAANADLKKQNDQLRVSKDQYEQKSQRLDYELRSAIERLRQIEGRNDRLSGSLEEVYRKMAIQEARRKRDRLAQDNVRLGKIQTVRTSPTSVGEVWEEGYALKELNIRVAEVSERREELEKRRNRLKAWKRKHMAKQSAGNDTNGLENTSYNELSVYESIADLEIVAEEFALRTHMEQLKRDESALVEARHLLDAEKTAHQKELMRCHYEDRSRFFKDLPCLNKRYLLLSMLGRGGFSEVWKALDIIELREVAVKIHQLNPTWSESRKQSYVKHVTREYTIHRDLNHPRVVLLFDVFEIDVHCFATVLELCRGTDLEEKLKTQKTLPEKDAKTILMQIIFGLRYLHGSSTATTSTNGNEDGNGQADVGGSPMNMPPPGVLRRRSIIHFDLKPANILFDSVGDVKITDFGLSKILDEADEGMTSVELTSQGAGTYWYLPPECFDRGGEGPPRISSKVDVWSLGVILYQMLYGKRPFGEGKTQERVLSEGIVLNATRVDFPQEGVKTSGNNLVPKVSDEAKDFVRACLTWDQRHRPDVVQLCQHPYLRPQTKKS